MKKIEVLQTIINRIKAKTYLEIGVDKGNVFFSVQAKIKYAVDPSFKFELKETIKRTVIKKLKFQEERYFEITSDDFFSNKASLFRRNKIDVALIDGLHTYQQTLKDVSNCLKYLNKGGVLVLHDCNPTTEAMAYPAVSLEHAASLNLKGWAWDWSGDVWKTIVDLRSSRNDLNIFVLNCDCGLGIVTRGNPENTLNYRKEDIEAMTYHDLEAKREELLNLRPPDFLQDFIVTL
jgi:hypothetical protein